MKIVAHEANTCDVSVPPFNPINFVFRGIQVSLLQFMVFKLSKLNALSTLTNETCPFD